MTKEYALNMACVDNIRMVFNQFILNPNAKNVFKLLFLYVYIVQIAIKYPKKILNKQGFIG